MFGTARRLLTGLCVAIGCALIAALAIGSLSWLSNLEDRSADLRIALLQPPEPQSGQVTVIAIDEDTIAKFAYRSPVDRKFLANLLTELEKRGARAIGVDLLFDQPTEPDKDALLHRTLRSLSTPLSIAFTREPEVVNARQLRYLEEFVPDSQRALASLENDPVDGTVRKLPAEVRNLPSHMVRQLARAAGVNPTDAAIDIAWHGKPSAGVQPFEIIAAHQLGSVAPEALRNKVVLVGLTLSLSDRHRTPFSMLDPRDEAMMPAILIHAHALSQLLEARPSPRANIYLTAGACLALAAGGALLGLARVSLLNRLIGCFALIAILWTFAFAGYRFGLALIPVIAPTLALLLTLWAVDFFEGRAERAKRRWIQQAFARYVSPAVARKLIVEQGDLTATARQQEATFIFTDIEGFTELSEKLDPKVLTATLNDYLTGACGVIFEHEGSVDKFLGDGIMVVFNSPVAQPDHVERAMRCALALDRYAQAFRARYLEQGIPLGCTRIGVHCGVAQIGAFGSSERLEFTALGDAVNTAARVEDANRLASTRLCCTAAVVARAPDALYMPLGEVLLRGKERRLKLFTHALSLKDGNHAMAAAYNNAYALLEAGLPEAVQAFEHVLAEHPSATPAAFHLARLRAGSTSCLIN